MPAYGMVCDLRNQVAAWGVDLIPIPALPTLVQDIIGRAETWGNDGKSGKIDPFTEIYDVSLFLETCFLWLHPAFPSQLVFLTTARLTTCHELTKNEADLKRIGEVFMIIQKSSTPASLLLPWFPSPARRAGKQATTELYIILQGYVEARRKADPTSDAMIDVFIADGETTRNIVGVSFDPNLSCLA